MQFYGHYQEPNLEVTVPMAKLLEARNLEIEMIYHVPSKTWQTAKFMTGDAERNPLGDAQFKSIPFDYSSPQENKAPAATAGRGRIGALTGGAAADRASSQKRVNFKGAAANGTNSNINRIKNAPKAQSPKPRMPMGAKKGPGARGLTTFEEAKNTMDKQGMNYADLL